MDKEETPEAPLPVKIIGWFGIILSITYLSYGIISIILSILDRTYQDVDKNIVIIIYGLAIVILSVAFKNLQKWGWIGLMVILAFFIIWAVAAGQDVYGYITGVLCLLALAGMLHPGVRKHYFST